MKELNQLDEQLNDMRAEKYAAYTALQQSRAEETGTVNDGEEDQEEDEEEDAADTDNQSPVSAEINGLFDDTSSVGKMAEKVNSTLNQMSERIHSFPQSNADEGKKQE